jgi:alpha-1,3-mannosyltransferase
MNLHQSAHIIPQLLGAIVEVVRLLGPDRCVISVVEGRSTDGTFEILKSLVKEMEHLGVSYFLSCNELQPGGNGMERIFTLAELRNMALRPLTRYPGQFDVSTTIIFLNDVVPCGEDILELILQRALLKADMTCGMDWYNLDDGEGGTFYDSWIGRQMNGETFFEVPQSTSWDFSKNLFWDHETSKSRYSLGQPLQVFSCWNGAAAIAAKPFMDGKIRFRTEGEGECHLGEPVHLAKDLWRLGYSKIAVIPSVNLGYSVEDSMIAKDAHGWASKTVVQGSRELDRIVWQEKPPGQIKCLEGDWHKPSWEPFDLHPVK